MSRFSSFVLGIFIGAAGLYVAMQYHVVRANDGFHMIPKLAAKLENPYVDIRKFTLEEWQKRQPLALAIMKANQGNLMQDSALGGFKQAAQKTLEQLSTGKSSWSW